MSEKTVKNRLHLDLATSDSQATIETAISLGGRHLQDFEKHTAMADPEGNEFCVLHDMPSDRPWQPPT